MFRLCVVALPRLLQGGLLLFVLGVGIVLFPADVHVVFFDSVNTQPILLDEVRYLRECVELVSVGEHHYTVVMWGPVPLELCHTGDMVGESGGASQRHCIVAKFVGAA